MTFKYLLIRENAKDNQTFDTLHDAREYQRLIPASECSGIVRVASYGRSVSVVSGIKMSYQPSADTGFVLLTLE